MFISENRFKDRMFKVLDAKTGKPVWKTSEIDRPLCVTRDLLVLCAVELISYGDHSAFGKTELQAFNRDTFKRAWTRPIPENYASSSPDTVLKSPYLIYIAGRDTIVVLDCSTGQKLQTRKMILTRNGWIVSISIYNGQLVWLTYESDHADFNNTKHVLHFCTIPELKEEKTITLTLIEIAKVTFEGEFIISDALYRTACFRMTGERVWERFQTERTKVIDNQIYFSDYFNKTARLGRIEVPTGKETILYTEKLKTTED